MAAHKTSVKPQKRRSKAPSPRTFQVPANVLSDRQWRIVDARARRHFLEAHAFYKRNKSRLLRDARYRGRYVAIRHKRVVDVDVDKFALAERLMARYTDQQFYVHHVLRHEPVIVIDGIDVLPIDA